MSIKDREYYCGVNEFKTPTKVQGTTAIGARLMELIMMEPGDDPLHPDMGVGLNTYRYSLDQLQQLEDRITNQIETYLPFYQGVNVALIRTPNKVVNIEISMGDMLFIYDSETVPKPVTLSDI